MIQDMHERLKKSNERRNCGADEEIASLRAENGRLGGALMALRPRIEAVATGLSTRPTATETQCLYDEADDLVRVIDATLAASPEQKPETCVWTPGNYGGWITGCNFSTSTKYEKCFGCGKRVEVRE